VLENWDLTGSSRTFSGEDKPGVNTVVHNATPSSNSAVFPAGARTGFWPHDLILWLLPIMLVAQVIVWSTLLPAWGLRGIADFRQLYTGGYMLRTGHAKELSNWDAQKRYEDMLVPLGSDYMLPINHLPYEELLFVPLSFLGYRSAYLVFLLFNGFLLGVSIWLLHPNMKKLSDRWKWFPFLLFAAFYPISRAMIQGQDSIILLTLLAGALWALDRNLDLMAGLLIGASVFKFQIAIPIALLFLIWRRWRLFIGFTITGTIAGLISLWLIGFHGLRAYADTLLGMSVHLNSTADMHRYGTIPTAMTNLRGLETAVLHNLVPPFLIQIMIVASSIVILWIAARRPPSLPLAITAAALVSYHFLSHDASILIVPIATVLCCGSVLGAAVASVLFFLPIVTAVHSAVPVAFVLLVFFFFQAYSKSKSAEQPPKTGEMLA
jgi:glycosyl transferase family 87